MKKISLYFYTIKDLKFEQIFFRIYYKIFGNLLKKQAKTKISQNVIQDFKTPQVMIPFISEKNITLQNENENENKKITILNITASIEINNSSDWNKSELPKLWLYNLHYMSYLNQENGITFIKSWIKCNDNFSGNGWEPYPLSLRIVNWIKFDLSYNQLDIEIKKSLFDQATYLSFFLERHILANHYFENLKTLLIAGVYFNNNDFYQRALAPFNRELDIQILPDGAHFELSPMYHSIILEGMLDLINIHRTFNKEIPIKWMETTQLMIRHLKGMIHPDGDIAFFSDSTFKIAKTPSEIFAYAKSLGFNVDYEKELNFTFNDAGYFSFKNSNFYLVVDGGGINPIFQPGHAHADNLSFELSIKGLRFFVNSGISTYENNELRLTQRKTRFHNTVEINGLDQSQVWGAFRVAKKANCTKRIINILPGQTTFSADHDKDSIFFIKPIHHREFILLENTLIIEDSCTNLKKGNAKAYYYLHPEVTISKIENSIKLSRDGIEVLLENANTFDIQDAKYYPEYNIEIPNKVLISNSGIFKLQL